MKKLAFGTGICYSGYREGQSPVTKIYPSTEQIEEDLRILEGDFDYIRMYDAGPHAYMTMDVIAKNNINIKVMLGMDLLGEISNPECAWGGEYTEEEIKRNITYNNEQLERLIELANTYPEQVLAVSAGNEATPEWNENLVSVERVLYFVKELKKRTNAVVTYCDNVHFWHNKLVPVAEEVDVISLHSYPVWIQRNVQDGKGITKDDFYGVQHRYPNKQCIITETGWPTLANGRGFPKELASQLAQYEFDMDISAWSKKEEIIVFFFEAFDEPWKGGDSPLEPEKHWGYYDVKRKPKIVRKGRR